jgi:hypothetical protein
LCIEHFGNSSPGLCIDFVIEQLILQFGEEVDLIFFDRPGLNTVFADRMRTIAKESYPIPQQDVFASQTLIAQVYVDILLYMAIPTDKITYMLAHSR